MSIKPSPMRLYLPYSSAFIAHRIIIRHLQHSYSDLRFADFNNQKIKETWSGLSDSDVKLYDDKRDEFFARLKEKSNVSREDAQQKIQQLEKDCGCSSTTRAA